MRIPIRIQLGGLLLVSSLIGLAVISIATWILIHTFVLDLRASRLALTASLKAAQLASNLDVMLTSASFVSTRVLVQNALSRYNKGNNTAANWVNSIADLQAAVGGDASLGQALLLQTRVWPMNDSGPGSSGGLINVTAQSVLDRKIALPLLYANGTSILLGADDIDAGVNGYPPALYPNLTYFTEPLNATYSNSRAMYDDVVLIPGAALLLGPWRVSSTLELVSVSMAITDNNQQSLVLGYLTVVLDARLILAVLNSNQGLGNTGQVLLLGPARSSNVFTSGLINSISSRKKPKPVVEVEFVVPLNDTYSARHPNHVIGSANLPFNASDFPTIYNALGRARASDDSGANLHAKNEEGTKVSVGYAMVQDSTVDWIVMVEQSRTEVWQPINRLRNVILVCLFATAILMAVISFPLAHFASLPIIRLRQAAARSMEPPGNSRSSLGSFGTEINHRDGANENAAIPADGHELNKEAPLVFANPVSKWKQKRDDAKAARRDERRKRAFRIPGKVQERNYCIKDELSELTSTFNEMSDELMAQYTQLEERVQERTRELELSKRAAEAANESKTLFIANISHELKTPLNGILGMTAVCLSEQDPLRLKRSLGIIYKSGDLLLNLLTDLLTFSKNEVGQHLSLDEKEFRLRDISTQILAIFEKQAREGNISLRVEFEGVHNATLDNQSPERRHYNGPADTGRMRDMILWGDVHRILQVVINLISNALKFTPQGGSVVLTVRCLPELPQNSRSTSMNSRQSKHNSSRHRTSETFSVPTRSSFVNVARDKTQAFSASERNASPPPGRFLYFEFVVEDTGPGIREDMLGKIFLPFVQADLGLSKKYGGTGLGLSICSQLANLMRGTISVKSTVGLGSTFTMKVPLRLIQSRPESSTNSVAGMRTETSSRSASFENEPQTQGLEDPHDSPRGENPGQSKLQSASGVSSASQPRLVGLSQPFFASSQPMESPGSQPGAMKHVSSEATRGDRIRVLVAEDNTVNQEVVLRMLKLEDIYDVTVAKDGQEALDYVKESMRGDDHQAFNLIFMDVQMPNVDGLQSTRLIREIGYQAPIVALTAFAEESNIRDCLDSGMNYFLSKPIRRPQLKKVLKEYCQPIPEEESEEATTTPPGQSMNTGPNTTIVMINNPNPNPSEPPNGNFSK